MIWRILAKIKTKSGPKRVAEIVRVLLKNRGLVDKKNRLEFIKPIHPQKIGLKELGISLTQILKAEKRIKQAIAKKEKIIIYGDYDADGVCATAVLWEALNKLKANVMPFIPVREEGYGLKNSRIEKMAGEGVKLIVTVDQGIVCPSQVEKAEELGIDVIITDHHQPGKKLPKALAIVHSAKLAGVGVAWILAKELGINDGLDLVAIGTISDVCRLIGENRSMVVYGLEELRKTKRPGLCSLLEAAGLDKSKIGSFEVGYMIGPRLNASGRIDDPMDGLRLICTQNIDKAGGLAIKINDNNKKRQELTEFTLTRAREIYLSSGNNDLVIFVYDEIFEQGVIGLAAGKLKEEFGRPAIVLAPKQDKVWVASARSIDGFNIVDAIRDCSELIGEHGGHPKAAGFSVNYSNIELLRKKLNEIARGKFPDGLPKTRLIIDAEVNLSDINEAFFETIRKFEPFGEGNKRPVFVIRQANIIDAKTIGNDRKHLKIKIEQNNKMIEALGFGMGKIFKNIDADKPVDLAFSLMENQWNGRRQLQLRLEDIRM